MTLRFAIYLLLLLLITMYGALNFKRLSAPFKLLTILIAVTLISESLSRLFIYQLQNSAPADYLAAGAEFVLIAFIYYHLFNNKRIKYILLGCIPLYLLAETFYLIYYQSLFEFPSVLISVQELACIVFSLLYFAEMLLYPVATPLTKQSGFWLNTSLFLFSAIVFSCFGLMHSLIVNQVGTKPLSTFIYALNMLFYGFIGFSIYTERKATLSE